MFQRRSDTEVLNIARYQIFSDWDHLTNLQEKTKPLGVHEIAKVAD